MSNLDILAVAKALANEHPQDGVCIHEPASELKAGGGVKGCAGALEENLWRRTTLYAHLARHACPMEGGIKPDTSLFYTTLSTDSSRTASASGWSLC